MQFIEGRRHPCLYAVAIPYGPVYSENHRDSPVARRHDGRCPFHAGCTMLVMPVAMHLALCSFSLVLRPMMLGIMAGMVQMDSYSVMCKAGIAGATVEFPQLQFMAGRAGYFPVVAQWPFYGPDCSSDLFLPQVQHTMADVPVVQVELFSWFRR